MRVRELDIQVPLALAPMVGLSHSAMRLLLMELGGVGLFYTEMLAAKRLPFDNPEVSPMLVRDSQEKPLIYQIFLADEEPISRAVEKLHYLGADGVDVNLGCPAPQLRRRGAGGFLAENITAVTKIIAGLRKQTELPLSAKIRLGSALDDKKLRDFCKMLEVEGVDFLTVHGRLHKEKFCRPPRWDWIGKVKEHLNIPVIANGGIFSVADARRCLEMSGADGLMLGRGGVERPWLFAEIAKNLYGYQGSSQISCKKTMYYRFIELLEQQFQPERRLGRLKQFTHYFAEEFAFGHHLASTVQRSNSMVEAVDKASCFFHRTDESEIPFSGGK